MIIPKEVPKWVNVLAIAYLSLLLLHLLLAYCCYRFSSDQLQVCLRVLLSVHDFLVWFFYIFLVAMGAFCVYKCVYYLVGFALEDVELFSLSDLNICWSEKELCRKKIGLISMIVAAFALALCVTWFIVRREYFAFYFLDFINICICVYAIKSSQIRSLRVCFEILRYYLD